MIDHHSDKIVSVGVRKWNKGLIEMHSIIQMYLHLIFKI
jgi:hypothetical protein